MIKKHARISSLADGLHRNFLHNYINESLAANFKYAHSMHIIPGQANLDHYDVKRGRNMPLIV
jgi:hypothetical protein